jgi:hypothetical protein
MTVQSNIALMHGAWADGSRWGAVIERMQVGGYTVTAPQFLRSSIDPVAGRVMRDVQQPLAVSAART